MSERPVPHPIVVRAVMIGLGLVQAVNGLWALFAPRSFYDDFPPGRGGWVSGLPAYNEHLMTDVGALFLATGVLLIVAAVRLERFLVGAALVTWLLFAVPHTVWHLAELGPYDTGDAVANVVALALTVVLPAALLVLLARPAAPRAPATAAANGGPRLRPVERSGNPVVRYAFATSRHRFGRVPGPVAVTAHHPGLLLGWGALERATERAHELDDRVKYLAVMKTAALAGCEWCMDFGSEECRAKGISDDDLRALPAHRESERFSEAEKVALDYATAMTQTPVAVSDELFARVAEHFDEAQIVELTSLIALENYRGRFNWALGIGGEGYSEGGYCVRAERPAAAAPS